MSLTLRGHGVLRRLSRQPGRQYRGGREGCLTTRFQHKWLLQPRRFSVRRTSLSHGTSFRPAGAALCQPGAKWSGVAAERRPGKPFRMSCEPRRGGPRTHQYSSGRAFRAICNLTFRYPGRRCALLWADIGLPLRGESRSGWPVGTSPTGVWRPSFSGGRIAFRDRRTGPGSGCGA